MAGLQFILEFACIVYTLFLFKVTGVECMNTEKTIHA